MRASRKERKEGKGGKGGRAGGRNLSGDEVGSSAVNVDDVCEGNSNTVKEDERHEDNQEEGRHPVVGLHKPAALEEEPGRGNEDRIDEHSEKARSNQDLPHRRVLCKRAGDWGEDQHGKVERCAPRRVRGKLEREKGGGRILTESRETDAERADERGDERSKDSPPDAHLGNITDLPPEVSVHDRSGLLLGQERRLDGTHRGALDAGQVCETKQAASVECLQEGAFLLRLFSSSLLCSAVAGLFWFAARFAALLVLLLLLLLLGEGRGGERGVKLA